MHSSAPRDGSSFGPWENDDSLMFSALGAAGVSLWTLDIATEVLTYAAAAGDREGGRTVAFRAFLDGVHPEDRDLLQSAVRRCAATGEPYSIDFRVRRQDGSYGWRFAKAMALRAGSGTVDRVLGVGIDTDQSHRLREARGREREFLSALLDSMTEGVIACDAEGRLTVFNRAAAVMHQTPADSVAPSEWSQRYSLTDDAGTPIPVTELPLWRALQGEEIHNEERTFTGPGGQPLTVLVNGTAIRSPDGTLLGAVVAMRDVTELKRAELALRAQEQRLRQGQKLEAVGQLAGSVAHDFNNILTAIKSYSQLLQMDAAEGSSTLSDALEIERAADRASALTRQLLAFSKTQTLQPRAVSLNTLVRELRGMLDPLLGKGVRLHYRLAPADPVVRADPGQLQQVVVNLAVNARDAMPEGGDLTIETASYPPAGEGAPAADGSARGTACLRVRDTGHGMDDAVRARLFEPFFTTKGNKGTGLGLATVYGIVEQSGGTINVDSSPGQGSSFEVMLPLEPGRAELTHRHESAPTAAVTPLRILLVDDEEPIRHAVSRMLESDGHAVVRVPGGIEALEAADASEFDLVLSDVVMPGMDGVELAARLRARHPGLPVVAMTGYLARGSNLRMSAHQVVLEKPFTADALRKAIASAMRHGSQD